MLPPLFRHAMPMLMFDDYDAACFDGYALRAFHFFLRHFLIIFFDAY